MNMLTLILIRIACGEKYEKTKKEDLLVWFSFLAAFPIALSASSLLFESLARSAPLWGIWLIGVAIILIGLLVWLGVIRLRSLPLISILAVVAWVGTYFVIYRSY